MKPEAPLPDLKVPRIVMNYRRPVVVVAHLALWTLSFYGAFFLRFDGHIPGYYLRLTPYWVVPLLLLRAIVHANLGLFHGLWRYTGMRDLLTLIQGAAISSALFVLYAIFIGPQGFPRSVFVIDWLLALMAVGGMRLAIRATRETLRTSALAPEETRKKILVVGAGDAGEMLVREIHKTHAAKFEVVGFVDDSPAKLRERIHGVTVLGPISSVADLVRAHGVDEVVVAIPSAKGKDMRQILDLCQASGASIRTIPGMGSLIDGRVTINQIRPVKIEDLLGREPVTLDTEEISRCINGAVVMITGAGGSIGSELCRQVCHFGPARLVLVEQAETSLFHIHRELRETFPDVVVVPRIGDICDTRRMSAVFTKYKPAVVFHAAAHKHVPMMEWNAGESIKNNVFGTRKLADLAVAHGVQQFVMISTDKAVNPTSIMGVSKRVAEIYCQALSQRSHTRFITVRFGNVLGSAGSVVPIFQEQILKGGPVSVTHPEMKRYFMTIPEASQLVMQAGAMGRGGEIFVLDMGEPVKIVDLARDLIRLSGLKPGEDVEIQFTGIRPGEKLFEELATDEEHADKTKHPKIFVGRFRPCDWDDLQVKMDELKACTDGADDATVRQRFTALVPEYKPTLVPGQATIPPSAGIKAMSAEKLAEIEASGGKVLEFKR
jgi:FlaA1/EpsC-like NDP-sugar epimerase